jgi:3-oxoacyl-[acyl-carrier protein] reductase
MTKTTRMERMELVGSAANENSATASYARAAHDAMVARTPLKRLGTAQEIANAVVFLASDASAYTIGQTLLVNGGTFIH